MTTTAVREKPILMSGPMVKALLARRKSQTRRVAKVTDEGCKPGMVRPLAGFTPRTISEHLAYFPFGSIGDRLWVRESWRWFGRWRDGQLEGGFQYRADLSQKLFTEFDEPRERWKDFDIQSIVGGINKWKPSIHMPRWASRINLEITEKRLMRLQEIRAKDILAEGVVERAHYDQNGLGKCPVSAIDGCCYVDLLSLWAAGWDKINGKRAGCAWKDNPWVWCLSFKVVKP